MYTGFEFMEPGAQYLCSHPCDSSMQVGSVVLRRNEQGGGRRGAGDLYEQPVQRFNFSADREPAGEQASRNSAMAELLAVALTLESARWMWRGVPRRSGFGGQLTAEKSSAADEAWLALNAEQARTATAIFDTIFPAGDVPAPPAR